VKSIILAALLLIPANRLWGSMVLYMVDATNIKDMPFVVVSDTAGYCKGIKFTIIADPKDPPYATNDYMHFHLEGADLSIYDSTNLISSCSVPGWKVPSFLKQIKAPLAEKGVVYEFTVGTNYLASAKFEVSYASGFMPAGNDYEFDLKTFIPVMNMGLTLGVKDKMIEITGVLPGTPAAKAGLTPGLIIQRIDGDDTSRMDLAMAKYMCGPIGGTADLELIDPATRQTKDVVLTTEKIFQ
jgi:hypothetical protein